MSEFKTVGKSLKKIDSLSLATGTEKFVDDWSLKDPVYLSILYSPHPHAKITNINDKNAKKIDGVLEVFSFKNVPKVFHTTAGQGYPEPSPYDTVLFDDTVRFVGDRVAMVVAQKKEIADRAVREIEVQYEILEPLFDPEKATLDDAPQIHESTKINPVPVKYVPEKNLASEVDLAFGDIEKGFKNADFIEEHTFRTGQTSHCALEPHAAISYYDERGRIVIVSTTQVPFHARRITSNVLNIPVGQIRVIKPRIGGGFGGKQEVFLEPLVALATSRLKRASKIVLSRKEVFISARTRHPMRIRYKVGFKKSGEITALELDALQNSGAYGSHALTVLSNAGSKVLPLFNKIENLKFLAKTVYTNLPVGGAYRGYGATQAYFGFCQIIDMIARKINIDPLEFIKKWHIKEGETSEIFRVLGEGKEGVSQTIKSCKLSKCIDIGAKEIEWKEKRGKKIKKGDRIKGIGFSVAMQGSGIPRIDMGAASMKMNEDGSFNLYIGATDIGTGSDTILAQMAAEVLCVPLEKLIVLSSDTDLTPFDVGAYACSTTYVSGGAVKKCAEKIKDQILKVASGILNTEVNDLYLEDEKVFDKKTKKFATFNDVAESSLYLKDQFQIQAGASQIVDESPAPFIAQFVDIDVDVRTGKIYLNKFVSAVDCGQAVNPALAEGQVEGAVVNGLSYALCEEYFFNSSGRMTNSSFWDYKIFTAKDIPDMKTFIVDSFEKTGPFGAKSVGEIGINGPLPAIANALYDAVGIRMFETPFTPEKILNKIKNRAE